MTLMIRVNLFLALSQGVDNTGDVYRATYTAFRCSSVSGTLGAHEKVQVGAGVLRGYLPSFLWCGATRLCGWSTNSYLVCLLPGAHYLPAQRRRGLRPVLGPGVPPCVRATAEKQSALPALRHGEHSFITPPDASVVTVIVFSRRNQNTQHQSKKSHGPLAVTVTTTQSVNQMR